LVAALFRASFTILIEAFSIAAWSTGTLLKTHGLCASMSAKGHCYDNAAMESFWSTLKTELIYRRKWNSRSEAKLALCCCQPAISGSGIWTALDQKN